MLSVSLCVCPVSGPPTQMTAEGPQGWLGPQTSCSSLPNTQSQMLSLSPEHLLPKAASVLLTPSASRLGGADSPTDSLDARPGSLTHGSVPRAGSMPDRSPWSDLRDAGRGCWTSQESEGRSSKRASLPGFRSSSPFLKELLQWRLSNQTTERETSQAIMWVS